MKQKLWLLQLPIVLLFCGGFYLNYSVEQGEIQNSFLRQEIFPSLQTLAGVFTNLKFKIRGPQAPRNKVVIVSIDEGSLETYGRWPWHRNVIAYLISKIIDAGAKVVGLDMVFAEPDPRVSEELAAVLRANGLEAHIFANETDPVLAETLLVHRSQTVLGWTTENACQPGYNKFNDCPVTHEDAIATHPKGFEKFAYSSFDLGNGFDPQQTPLVSLVTFIPNLEMYNNAAIHAGSFNTWPDSDGFIRRTPLLIMANSRPYPILALEMARVGKNDDLKLSLNEDGRVSDIRWKGTNESIPVSPLGAIELNFRGPAYTFPYVSAEEVMQETPDLHVGINREIASTKSDVLKDAYVLIGATAIGIYDMRAFPFDANTPGVEGHATILDNLLAMDFMQSSTASGGAIWIFLIMFLGALVFAYFAERMESIPAIILFGSSLGIIALFDIHVLFANNINWNTSLIYIEFFTVFICILAAKYILEEKQKKFIQGAMGRYISPAMVNEIVKDPSKLKLGGEKRELTILFSDIRGFTTLSEQMDPKQLAAFLNIYLGEMTDIIVEDHEGTLDKYIGDAIMAFWGAPILHENHASNGAHAAIKMMQKLREQREQFQRDFGIEVDAGIGINTGAVSVGNMGSEKNFNYTVLGDHVNLASRLEGLTKYYSASIIATKFTVDSIKTVGEKSGLSLPQNRILDQVIVKGKDKAVQLHQFFDREISLEAIEQFNEGRKLYEAQQWDAAIKCFEKTNLLFLDQCSQTDGTSLMYIERCQEFKNSPPNADWDGSWRMTSK